MLERDGLKTSEANEKYFRETLPSLAAERLAPGADRESSRCRSSCGWQGCRDRLPEVQGVHRRYLLRARHTHGEGRVRSRSFRNGYARNTTGRCRTISISTRPPRSSSPSHGRSSKQTQREMIDARATDRSAARVAAAVRGSGCRALGLRSTLQATIRNPTRRWCRGTARRPSGWSTSRRKTGLFDVPADYKLEVVETPPPLRVVDRRRLLLSGAAVQEHRRRPLLRHADTQRPGRAPEQQPRVAGRPLSA